MMWFLLLLYIAHIEPVDLQGTNRLVLRKGGNPCEGYPEIHHNNEWGYVGDTYWDKSTGEVVCSSTQCGKLVSTNDVLTHESKTFWIDEINCTGISGPLWQCKHPGFGATVYQQDKTKWIKCSDNIEIRLEGYKCAGAVKYTGTKDGYFCGDTWGKDEADVLCESLKCGTSKEIPTRYWKIPAKFKESKKMVVNCSGITGLDNLWQCAQKENEKCSKPAVVICEAHEHLRIKGNQSNVCQGELQILKNGIWTKHTPRKITEDVWCDQMSCGGHINYKADSGELKCSDKISVTLMSNSTKCYGEVHINKNGSYYPVCATDWSKKDADVVCEELQCGKVISTEKRQRRDNKPTKGIMDNVECSGNESSLWHCKAKRDNIQCSANAFVVCAGSIDVRLEDSPGKCAGRVEIEYGGQWYRVTDDGWTSSNSDSVCQHLDCGAHRSTSAEKQSQNLDKFLGKAVQCPSSNSKISDCIGETSARPDKAVTVTCEEHKMVFLDKQCNGKVGIEKGENTFWLSGHNETWTEKAAAAVCRQMHCGEYASHYFNPRDKRTEEVWHKSYNCSSNATSLFECDEEANIQNDMIATVKCNGNITVNLTKACWGNVNICVGEKCGGVCSDTWTTEKSQMLCENLNCGSKVLDGLNPPTKYNEVTVKSVHTAKKILNLNQSNLVMYDKKDSTCKPAYVVCSGSVKARIITTISKCSGNLELEYEGEWLPVCMAALNDSQTQNILCKQQQCGKSIKVLDLGLKEAGARAIQQINCHGKKSLKECEITARETSCKLGGLKCSSWRKMEVKFNTSCSGYVYVYSEGKKSAVSFEGWNVTEGQTLCRDLQCGNFISGQGKNTTETFWNRTLSCGLKNPKNIWDCEKERKKEKEQQQQLYIECKGEPSVSLSHGCSGEVKIDNVSVCSDTAWKMEYSHLVCKELKCSNAYSFDIKQITGTGKDMEYQHVTCEDYHGKLGQCSRFKKKCSGGLVMVSCVNSIKFSFSDKPCGGVIEVETPKRQEKVCLMEVPNNLKNKLCQSKNCGDHNSTFKLPPSKEETLNLMLKCNKDYNSLHHCVKHSNSKCSPAEIYCTKYEPIAAPAEKKQISVVSIILGVGLTLIVVILIVVFVRVCIVRRAKRPMYAASRTFEREEVEFESGDYEDVTGKANEMEALSQGKFGPNSDIIVESDGRSNTSLPYDDIDEAVEAQTSPAATAAASGDTFFHEAAVDQSTDGVTYEVDDPQESYDDIEASPEISQIKAEVHSSPQTTPESAGVAPSGLRDEDYLVPGQDG
ncbi:scavenger receptor cysteine-rich type 1 protein M130 [Acanthopagrus schlegelii]